MLDLDRERGKGWVFQIKSLRSERTHAYEYGMISCNKSINYSNGIMI